MPLDMREANLPTTEMAIAEFERGRGLKLPEAYREFLLFTNGGVPSNPTFPIAGLANNPLGDVQVFFGLGSKWPGTDLAEIYDRYGPGIPRGVVPVADNGGGDYVCLDLRNNEEKVAFWDKGHFWSTAEWREDDLYPVAPSFAAFLEVLGKAERADSRRLGQS